MEAMPCLLAHYHVLCARAIIEEKQTQLVLLFLPNLRKTLLGARINHEAIADTAVTARNLNKIRLW